MRKPHDNPLLKLSDLLFDGAAGGWTVNFEMHNRCKELESERDALRASCEWMEKNMHLSDCPPDAECEEFSCTECQDAYLQTEPWKEKPDA